MALTPPGPQTSDSAAQTKEHDFLLRICVGVGWGLCRGYAGGSYSDLGIKTDIRPSGCGVRQPKFKSCQATYGLDDFGSVP